MQQAQGNIIVVMTERGWCLVNTVVSLKNSSGAQWETLVPGRGWNRGWDWEMRKEIVYAIW